MQYHVFMIFYYGFYDIGLILIGHYSLSPLREIGFTYIEYGEI